MELANAVAPRLRSFELRSIYETYGSSMLRRCQQITRDPNLADDAFQDSFMNLIRYGSGFRKVESKKSWLYTVCDRACFSTLKKRSPHEQTEDFVEIQDESEQHPIRLEQKQAVSALWEILDEDEQQIAKLRYIDGFTQSKIGTVLKLSRQTINKKLGKINLKAKAFMQEDYHTIC